MPLTVDLEPVGPEVENGATEVFNVRQLRRFYFTKADLKKYGYSQGRMACGTSQNGSRMVGMQCNYRRVWKEGAR